MDRSLTDINPIRKDYLTNTQVDKSIIKKRKRTYFLLLFLYRLFLDILYVNVISKEYAYYGLDFSYSFGKVIIVYLFVFAILLPLTIKHILEDKPSSKLLFFFELMYFIPGTTFISYSSATNSYVFFFIAFFLSIELAGYLANRLNISSIKIKSEKQFKARRKAFDVFIVVLLAFTVFYLLYFNGFKIKFDFNNVYSIRAMFRDANIPTFINYIKNPTAILVPVLLFLCIKRGSIYKALLLIVLQLMIYAFGANKIHLLSMAVSIALALANKKIIYYLIIGGLAALTLFGIIYSGIIGHLDNISDILIRRTFFTPQKMSYDYFTCFSTHEPDYWRSSFLRFFGVTSPYGEITYYIGIYNGTFSNCDNGLVGDAFGNLGYMSLLVYPILYFLVFMFYNIACKGCREEILIFLSFLLAIVFYDSPFFSALLTHGFIFIILFFTFLFPYKGKYQYATMKMKGRKHATITEEVEYKQISA